jgi:hypothetical protein
LLTGWDAERERGRFPDATVTAAYLPAVCRHLRDAYGWFLLAVCGIADAPAEAPPETTAELAAPESGRERPPELREFELLERDGWLADLLAADLHPGPVTGGEAGVIGSDRGAPGYALVARWASRLEETMQRMDDLLAES